MLFPNTATARSIGIDRTFGNGVTNLYTGGYDVAVIYANKVQLCIDIFFHIVIFL